MIAHECSEDQHGELHGVVQGQTEEEGNDDAQRGRVAFVATCYAGGRCLESAFLRASIIVARNEEVVCERERKVEVH